MGIGLNPVEVVTPAYEVKEEGIHELSVMKGDFRLILTKRGLARETGEEVCGRLVMWVGDDNG